MDFREVFPVGFNDVASNDTETNSLSGESEALSDAQLKVLPILCFITGFLSVLGSSTIIYMILSQRKKRLNQSYHRIMLVLSCYDVVWSIWLALGPIPVPKETGAFLAYGNEATCRAQGFVTIFGFVVLSFSDAFLMVYFLLVIRWNVREGQLRRWEPYVHGVIFCSSVATCLLFLAKDMYSYVGLGPTRCLVGSYPQGCQKSPDVECERGEDAATSIIVLMIPFAVIYFIIFASIIGVIWTVQQQSRRSRQLSFVNERSEQNNRMVVVQSCLYFFFFVNTFVWSVATGFLEVRSTTEWSASQIYPLEVLHQIFLPLQGFANLLIYTRPRFLRIRRLYHERSLWFQLKETIVGNKPLLEHQRCLASRKASDYSRGRTTPSPEGSRLTSTSGSVAQLERNYDDGGDCLDPSQMLVIELPANAGDEAHPSQSRRRSSIDIRGLEQMMEVVARSCSFKDAKDINDKKEDADDISNDQSDRTCLQLSCPTLNPALGQGSSTDDFSVAAKDEGSIHEDDAISEFPVSLNPVTAKTCSSSLTSLDLMRLQDSTADFPIVREDGNTDEDDERGGPSR